MQKPTEKPLKVLLLQLYVNVHAVHAGIIKIDASTYSKVSWLAACDTVVLVIFATCAPKAESDQIRFSNFNENVTVRDTGEVTIERVDRGIAVHPFNHAYLFRLLWCLVDTCPDNQCGQFAWLYKQYKLVRKAW